MTSEDLIKTTLQLAADAQEKVGLNRYEMLTVIRLTVFSNGGLVLLMQVNGN